MWIRGRGQLGGMTNVVTSSEGARSLRSLLRHHPLRTRDPREACVFIPMHEDTACISNWCKEVGILHTARFSRLLYWRGSGRDHVVLHYSDHQIFSEVGGAILAKSSFGPDFDRSYYNRENPSAVPRMQPFRNGFDVMMPLSGYRCFEPLYGHLGRYHRRRRKRRSFSAL